MRDGKIGTDRPQKESVRTENGRVGEREREREGGGGGGGGKETNGEEG